MKAEPGFEPTTFWLQSSFQHEVSNPLHHLVLLWTPRVVLLNSMNILIDKTFLKTVYYNLNLKFVRSNLTPLFSLCTDVDNLWKMYEISDKQVCVYNKVKRLICEREKTALDFLKVFILFVSEKNVTKSLIDNIVHIWNMLQTSSKNLDRLRARSRSSSSPVLTQV